MVTKQDGPHHWTMSYRDCSSKQMVPISTFSHKPLLYIFNGVTLDIYYVHILVGLENTLLLLHQESISLRIITPFHIKRGGVQNFITSLGGLHSIIALQVSMGEEIYLQRFIFGGLVCVPFIGNTSPAVGK
jgi:hypothetical protein